MGASSFFGPWEGSVISSWQDAIASIEEVVAKSGNRTLAWRGQVDADWRLHSSLYRRLRNADDDARAAPKEGDLLKLESRVAEYVRKRWRFDDIPYLQLLAQLQHYRAPTRLLDVSLNPLVALWFAVERQHGDADSKDSRLFSFDVTKRSVSLTSKWTDYDIPWRHDGKNTAWCRELPLFWRPPAYNERIPAQQSGFLLAGVPKVYAGDASQYRKAPGLSGQFWRIDEVRHATSLPTRMAGRDRSAQERSEPTFTLRIAAEAKESIRARLERSFGINPSTMYPDAFGMAEETRKAIDDGELHG